LTSDVFASTGASALWLPSSVLAVVANLTIFNFVINWRLIFDNLLMVDTPSSRYSAVRGFPAVMAWKRKELMRG